MCRMMEPEESAEILRKIRPDLVSALCTRDPHERLRVKDC